MGNFKNLQRMGNGKFSKEEDLSEDFYEGVPKEVVFILLYLSKKTLVY
jgi:hypothetical protein